MKEHEVKAQSKYEEADRLERLQIKLSASQEKRLGAWIDEKRGKIERDRNDFVARHQKYLYNFDDFVTYNRKGPWDNSANLHMPLTAVMVKSYVSRLYNIFSQEETGQFLPREESDEGRVDLIRRLRKWYLWDYLNEYRGIRGFTREIFYDVATVGFGIGMKDFQVKMRKIIGIEPNELKREMEDLEPQIAEAQAGAEMLATEEEIADRSVEVAPYREVEKIMKVFEGTRLRSVSFEDCYFPNFIPESSNLDFPPMVMVETDMSVSDVVLKGKTGAWDPKKAKAVQKRDYARQSTQGEYVKQTRERLTGVQEYIERNDPSSRVIEYCFCSYDIDDDGVNEEIVVTKSGPTIIKVTFLERISPLGIRPLVKFDCFSKPRQSYSRGVPEFMYPLNDEMDQHHNMRIDYLSLQTCPFGVYRAASSLKSESIQISPGKFIPVDNITDMKVLNFNTNTTALASEEDRSWHYAERLASVSSLTQGIVPSTVGPTRSTSGVMALLRQMDKEFIVTVDQCAEQWKRMEKLIYSDLDLRIDQQLKLRVLGPKAKEASLPGMPEDLLWLNGGLDLVINVARAVTSDEVRRNDEEQILNKLAAPSVLQQMGVVGPKALYRSLSQWLKVFGKDPDEYLNMPEFLDRPLTLFQEIQFCAQGELPPMSMQDDHEVKAQGLVQFMQSPEYQDAKVAGHYDVKTDDMIAQAAKKHSMLAQMLQPKGLPNPQGIANPEMNEQGAGVAPQQGGQDPAKTSARELQQETKDADQPGS